MNAKGGKRKAMNKMDAMRSRRSVRTYTGEALSAGQVKAIEESLMETDTGNGVRIGLIKNQFGLKQFGTYGFIKGADHYIAGVCAKDRRALIGCGAAMEQAVITCEQLGLGTCWLGGSFKRSEFAPLLNAGEGELIPAVISVGVPREKERLLGGLMRAVAGSNGRKAFGELFTDGGFHVPLAEGTQPWQIALEMVRRAPSASNKQPWRIVKDGEAFHLYEQHAAHYGKMSFDMQLLDMGIAMTHFELAMMEQGEAGHWAARDPKLAGAPDGREYIASFIMEAGGA